MSGLQLEGSLQYWQKVNHAFAGTLLSAENCIVKDQANAFPFRLYIKELSISKSLFPQDEQKSCDVVLNVFLFDSKSMVFQSQATTPLKQLSLADKVFVEWIAYFCLDRIETSRFVVIEVVAKQKAPVEDISLGFGNIRLDGHNSSLQNIKMISGSARTLLFVDDPGKVVPSEDGSITYSVQSWPKLDAIRHLLPLNFLMPANQEIPGVIGSRVNAEFPAVGLDYFDDPHSLNFSVPCRITNVTVKMRPDVATVETFLQGSLSTEVEQNVKTTPKFKTTARKLKISLHNGLRYVFDSLNVPMSLSPDGILCVDSSYAQDTALQLPQHPAFALIFQLEVVFTEVLASSLFRKTAVPKTYTVVVGWGGMAPFGMEAGSLSSPANITLSISSEPDTLYNPDDILPCKWKDSDAVHGILVNATLTGGWTSTQLPTPAVPMTPVTPMAPMVQEHAVSEPKFQSALQQQTSYSVPAQQSVAALPDSQRKWPVEVRHLVDDDHKVGLIGTTVVHRHPNNRQLAVTPVHIPMPPLPPLQVASLPRAAYAQLYSCGFPIVRDRHGDLPEVIDPVSSAQTQLASVDLTAEKSDPLQGNEIVFQFLALSSFNHTSTAGLDQPQSIFFTFQFYNFPAVLTERMLMTCGEKLIVNDMNERLSSVFVLRGIDKQTGALAVQPPGCQVKFAIDSSVLKPGEEDTFWRYLLHQSLHIDVWDGDSLMLIGSCSVPIRFLLRQGKEAIQMTLEADVFSTEYGSLTSNIIADVTRSGSARYIDVAAVLKGRLHFRMANVGYVSDMRPIGGRMSALSKIYGGVSTGRVPIVESQSAQHAPKTASSLEKRLHFLADQTNRPVTGRTRIGQGAHLLEAAGNRALLDQGGSLVGVSLANDLMGAGAAGESLEDRTRKLQRFRGVLSAPPQKAEEASVLAHGAALMAYKHTRELRERNYQNLESYRDGMKHQAIVSLLCEAITSQHEIVTSFGRAEYFEFMLRNPTNEQHMVRIESQDSDLSIVTDPNEWRHYRRILGEPTSVVEENMFSVDASSPLVPEVFIKPREIVRIPFKYQTFKGYKADVEKETEKRQDDSSLSLNTTAKQLSKHSSNNRVIVVNFTSITSKGEPVTVTTEDGSTAPLRPLSVLNVHVQLQPHATDQVFRFYAPENAFLRKAIRLPPYGLQTPENPNERSNFVVRCSDATTIAEVRNNGPSDPQDIMLRIGVGASPNINNIMLAIFSDPYLSVPLQVWELWVHALQRYDVTCIEGETTKFSLVLRGTNSTRLVRCFTSHATELLVDPAIPFMLVSNAVHELSFTLKPMTAGQRLMVVNVVDLQLHQLIRSWLVCVSAEAPAFSSYYDLTLPVGSAGQTHNKKLAYKNPFGRTQTFYLKTNRNDLLTLREPIMAKVAPGETRDIGLRFVPSQVAGTAELAIYVNDEQDRNIESVCIRLAYITVAQLPGH